MAQLSGAMGIFSGDSADIQTTQRHPFGTRAYDTAGNEYLYAKGVSSGAVGFWATYDEVGVTTLLVANAIGPVGVMCSILDATTDFGWLQIYGTASAFLAANCADNVSIGYESTSGHAGDGKAAGDAIYGAVSRGATSGTAALATVQLNYPSVDDNSN